MILILFCTIWPIIIILVYYSRKDRLKQREELIVNWELYKKAVERKDLDDIIRKGVLLFQNPLLEPEQSKQIVQHYQDKIQVEPKYQLLKEAEYNYGSNFHSLTWFELFERPSKKKKI